MTKRGGFLVQHERPRTKGDAPQIDGAVHIATRRPLRVGEIATVKIERADAYDLHGKAVGY
jgi:ribosomal protein S12 methylthiotransferase